ncbi:NADH dehydrogenase [ubiquinone] 1 beta subcomplex subunit 11, mitochondrial [Orchesella cincta]|uniref:NADH dehydrogenase [ubiquinone] 1 beta subcomplex subunit 11, mitochondrial n=1 Tax=Orchesella cincta TaxID=48709 RepID=A0A1D2NFC4_ORCCI|nr:NADH dehydrogenase [ubiquinone] 1 beta subcomplex subunit 11, mitochondrial [Orchesella cincta]
MIQTQQPAAFISTSKKNRDTTIVTGAIHDAPPKTVEDFANPKTTWQSYGFDSKDPDLDINRRNFMFFITITIGIVGSGFIMTYSPDVRMKDWNQREAYIELARREALGLPPVDRNLVPVDQVELPSEEELGDFDIII